MLGMYTYLIPRPLGENLRMRLWIACKCAWVLHVCIDWPLLGFFGCVPRMVRARPLSLLSSDSVGQQEISSPLTQCSIIPKVHCIHHIGANVTRKLRNLQVNCNQSVHIHPRAHVSTYLCSYLSIHLSINICLLVSTGYSMSLSSLFITTTYKSLRFLTPFCGHLQSSIFPPVSIAVVAETTVLVGRAPLVPAICCRCHTAFTPLLSICGLWHWMVWDGDRHRARGSCFTYGWEGGEKGRKEGRKGRRAEWRAHRYVHSSSTRCLHTGEVSGASWSSWRSPQMNYDLFQIILFLYHALTFLYEKDITPS